MYPSLRSNTKMTTLPTLCIMGKLDMAQKVIPSWKKGRPNKTSVQIP